MLSTTKRMSSRGKEPVLIRLRAVATVRGRVVQSGFE
jgi:hypothetical protein